MARKPTFSSDRWGHSDRWYQANLPACRIHIMAEPDNLTLKTLIEFRDEMREFRGETREQLVGHSHQLSLLNARLTSVEARLTSLEKHWQRCSP